MTQAEFCKLLGTRQGFLSEVESSKKKPSAEMIIAIAINFKDLSLRWFLTGENYDVDQSPPLDAKVLEEVIEVVEWAIDQVKASPTPKKKAELISAVYDFYHEEGLPEDRSKLMKLVKAVA